MNHGPVRRAVAVDLFAGGGGASEGIRQATGVHPVLAVNHCPAAVAMHEANHPNTMHLCESVHDVEPGTGAPGGRVDILWASPDCTHFSRAKGGKPRKQEIRGLAWVVVEWARKVMPTVLFVENVPEFRTWGPLYSEDHPDESKRGRPIPEQKGETFRAWCQALEGLGYVVEHQVLVACDYGAPTIRKRLFVVARRDGKPIVWPTPTHGPGRAQPHRAAAECIDWSIPCPSIFERQRPLADKTCKRIAHGIVRYVLEAERPFLLNLTHGGRLEPLDEPFRTITAAHRGEKALVVPTVASIDHQSSSAESTTAPLVDSLSTCTTKARHLLVSSHLIGTSNGERVGQRPRARDLQAPAPTVTATGSQGAVVAAWLAKHYGGVIGHGLERPAGTVTSKDGHGLVAAHLTKFFGTSKHGAPLTAPAPTVTAGAGGGHAGLVAAFLTKYYGQGIGAHMVAPAPTVTSKDRLGLVTVQLQGESYVLVDIGMRMLQPRELARAQGFSDDYQLTGNKTQQVARIGNSVPPPVVRALVEAQFGGAGCPDLTDHDQQQPLWGYRFDSVGAA